MAVTLQQIAEAAGVSRGTVDRALNDRGRINLESRIRNNRKIINATAFKPVSGLDTPCPSLCIINRNMFVQISHLQLIF